MLDWLLHVSIESLLAVMTVSSVSVVPTVQTDSAADATRHLVEFHVEATLTGMVVALAS